MTCEQKTTPRRLLRGALTRLLYGGMTGTPCARCGRPTVYWGRYCPDYFQQMMSTNEGKRA